MIIAILQLGDLRGKIKFPARVPEIRVPVTLPMTIDWLQEASVPDSPNRHPILIFEWYKQVSKYKHIYRIKEIQK